MFTFVAACLVLAAGAHARGGAAAGPTFTSPRVSPDASVSQTVGITKLAVAYCRPA